MTFKMKGSPMQRNFGVSPMKVDPTSEKVTVVAKGFDLPSKRVDYEALVSKKTANLIKANAPKSVIDKQKAIDIKEYKKNKETKIK